MTDKQPAPKESGPYMVSDHGSREWTPAIYNVALNRWMSYSPFHPDGWYVIPTPDKWIKKDSTPII